ncbi:MAG TPA: PQQ-binding-like beta-propeller repeat protein [Gemmataceae bacterium]
MSSSAGPLAVISAPLLWPVAALLQLLFPALLRDRVRAYRWACVALVTQSALLTLHWLLGRFWPDAVAAWMPPGRLTWSLVAVTAGCAAAAWWQSAPPAGRPHRLEWLAFAALAVIFGGRALVARGAFDFGAALAVAAGAGLLSLLSHLQFGESLSRKRLTTQRVFLTALVLAGSAAAYHQQPPTPPAVPRDWTGDWPTFRGDVQRTGSLDPADAGPARPHVLWRARVPGGGRLYASPAAAGGEVVVVATQTNAAGGLFNRVARLDAASGRLVHTLDLPRAGVSSPAVRGPLVVLGEGYHQDGDCRLRVLDRRSGTEVGSFPTRSHVESSPALDGLRVYFGAGDDGLFAVELADDGSVRQLWHVGGYHVDSPPLVAGGTVFAGSIAGDNGERPALLAVDAMTGAVRWAVPVPLSAIAAPAGDDRRVVFALSNGKLNRDADRPAGAVWCVDAVTGGRLWQLTTDAGLYATPVCAGGNVFVAGGDGLCRCLRLSDGKELWQTPLGERVVASPVVSGGAVFVVTQSGLVVKLDAATGREVWRFDDLEELAPAGDVHASPVLAGGRLYVAAGGYLVCVGDRGE